MAMDTVNWTGLSAQKYTYYMHQLPWRPSADQTGNYIFAKESASGWQPLYFGETESFRARLVPSHEKLPCALRNGITHIHAHINTNDAARLAEESDLIAAYDAPCNKE